MARLQSAHTLNRKLKAAERSIAALLEHNHGMSRTIADKAEEITSLRNKLSHGAKQLEFADRRFDDVMRVAAETEKRLRGELANCYALIHDATGPRTPMMFGGGAMTVTNGCASPDGARRDHR